MLFRSVEVQPHLVTILADTALRASDLDEAAAQAVKAELAFHPSQITCLAIFAWLETLGPFSEV